MGTAPPLSSSPCSVSPGVLWISQHTEGFSGSDLVELCSHAAQRALTEHWEQLAEVAAATGLNRKRSGLPPQAAGSHDESATTEIRMRMLVRGDFEEALKVVRPSGAAALEYKSRIGGD